MQAGKVKLTVSDEPFNQVVTPQFYEKLTRVTEREKIRVTPEIEVDPKVRREFTSIYKDLFGRLDAGDSYQEFANTTMSTIDKQFIEQLNKMDERRNKSLSPEYSYPEGSKINTLKIELLRLTQIREPEQLVKSFIDAEDDLFEWQKAIEQLSGFYLKKPIERFDEAVIFLNQSQNDLRYTQSDQVNLLKKQMTDILTKAAPYRDIPLLPSLIEKLGQAIHDEVVEQKQGLASQIVQLEKKLEDIKDYYSNNDLVTALIQQRMPQFKVLQQEILESGSLVTIQLNLAELRNVTEAIQVAAKRKEEELYRQVQDNPPTADEPTKPAFVVHEKGTKVISSRELKTMLTRTSIETQSDLDAVLTELRTQLIKELKDNILKIEL